MDAIYKIIRIVCKDKQILTRAKIGMPNLML